PNMNNQIASGEGDKVRQYLTVMKEGKSSTGILAIDAGDSNIQGRYEQKTAQFTGLSDVITKMMSVLAGALDRPITVLFGQSASGFNSGEEDNKSYYETINGLQESRLRPLQDFIDQFILDKLSISDELKYEYPSIDSINEAELATRFTAYSTGFTSMLQSSIMDEETVLREMIARGLLVTVTEDDIKRIVESSGYSDYGTSTTFGAQTGAT
ncbi:phage portal protein, partial [Providencia rettgeri]